MDPKFRDYLSIMNNEFTEEIIMIPDEITDKPNEFMVQGISG